MRRFSSFITYLVILLTLFGCGTIKPVPVETIIQYETRDSLVLRDSTVIIPVERVVDVVPPYDTLKLETSMAEALAWVDTTTHTLKGKLENKTGIQYKYLYKDRVEYRDSIVTKEIPVEVEKIVNKHYPYEKWLWMYFILSIAAIAFIIYSKIRR